MCMQCVAGSAPYVAGALGSLKLMGRKSRASTKAKAQVAPQPVAAPAALPTNRGAQARKTRRAATRERVLVDA